MKSVISRGYVNIIAAVVIMAVMATSFLAGINIGRQNSSQYVINGSDVPDAMHQPLDDLMLAYQHLNADSYWRPFDQKALMYGAVSGLLSNCCLPQDTHTTFSEPVTSKYQSQVLNEQVYGIGAQVEMTNAGLVITAPYFNSPAMKAGLQTGDVITSVNGHALKGMDGTKAVDMIHGSAGTIVKLTIMRPGTAKPFVVDVTRGSIPSVIVSNSGSVGYIQFSDFAVNTGAEVHGALQRLIGEHVKYLVIDLRDNGGGYVFAAQAIASEFLPMGSLIFWSRSNIGNGKFSDEATRVVTPGIAQHIPIVVLVNGGTASAAEILTAALRDDNRARVVGVTTYGKGSEQEDLTLPDGAGLRITVNLWLTPKKHEVNGTGITPDVVVSQSDQQLSRAVQYLVTGH
jgi:carboxyl-terminal processing protease